MLKSKFSLELNAATNSKPIHRKKSYDKNNDKNHIYISSNDKNSSRKTLLDTTKNTKRHHSKEKKRKETTIVKKKKETINKQRHKKNKINKKEIQIQKKKIKKMKVVGILREHVSEWVYRSPFINSRRGTTSVGRHRPNQTEPARCACLVTPKPRPNALSWFKRSLI